MWVVFNRVSNFAFFQSINSAFLVTYFYMAVVLNKGCKNCNCTLENVKKSSNYQRVENTGFYAHLCVVLFLCLFRKKNSYDECFNELKHR